MRIVPALNCKDADTLKAQFAIAAALSPWVHIDVSDGRFTPARTWGNPAELRVLRDTYPSVRVEVHLMVEQPEAVLPLWLDSGANRAVVHWEALSDRNIAQRYPETAIVFGTKIETSVEGMFPYIAPTSSVLILAVPPGYSGQSFDASVIEKIAALREHFPELEIEVDGGVNPTTIPLIKEAANAALSASYIFRAPDPKRAFAELLAA